MSVAYALSLGNRAAVPEALLVLTLIGLALGTLGASRISVVLGRTPWVGLVISMSPGLLFATTVSTTETVVLSAWIGYAHVRLGTWPKPDDAGSLSVPPMGWVNPGQSQSPDRVRQ